MFIQRELAAAAVAAKMFSGSAMTAAEVNKPVYTPCGQVSQSTQLLDEAVDNYLNKDGIVLDENDYLLNRHGLEILDETMNIILKSPDIGKRQSAFKWQTYFIKKQEDEIDSKCKEKGFCDRKIKEKKVNFFVQVIDRTNYMFSKINPFKLSEEQLKKLGIYNNGKDLTSYYQYHKHGSYINQLRKKGYHNEFDNKPWKRIVLYTSYQGGLPVLQGVRTVGEYINPITRVIEYRKDYYDLILFRTE